MTNDRLRPPALAWLLYALLVIACLYPQSLRPWDTVGYIGDSLDTTYFIAWNAHQLFRDPLHLFDANMLHPHRESMALAGHRILLGLVTAPVIWASGNPILAYNVATALGYLLAAFAGFRLARALAIEPIGAWAAGALYAFHSFQINEAPRADLLYHCFTTLALAELVDYLRSGERRRAWHVAGLMLLQGLASNYLLMYGALLLSLVTLAALLARPRRVGSRLLGLALPAALAGVLFLPVLLPHVRSAHTYGFSRELTPGIDLRHYVSTIPTNLIYGEIGEKVRPQQRGPHFVGFLSLALAMGALVLQLVKPEPESGGALLPRRVWVPAAAVLALAFVALSLGRDLVLFGWHAGPGPYRLLHRFVPGFALIRIPERLALIAMLFVALLAGEAVARVGRRWGWGLAGALALAVPLEHLSPLPLTQRMPAGNDVPAVYRWLARAPVQALAEVPVHGEGLIRKETIEEYFSSYHFKPIVHGYVSYPPLLSVLLRRMAAEFPSELSLQAFQRVGVDTVVVHHGRSGAEALSSEVEAAAAAGRIVSLARFSGPEAHVYEASLDETFRISPAPPLAVAPMPTGRRMLDPAWHYDAKVGDPRPAGDGDLSTVWYVPGELKGDEYMEVVFDRPLKISGIALPLRRDSAFPTRLRFEARGLDGRWGRLARLDDAHVLQLVDQLLRTPGAARLGFSLPDREVTGVRLLVGEGALGFDGWAIPELEVWVP